MFNNDDWNDIARKLLSKIEGETRQLADDTFEMPASYYTDEERWRLEVELIFRRMPLILIMSCELAEPNSFKALDIAGVPVLLTRGEDGKVSAFLNKCRHRGAILTGEVEKSGVAKRFACPYHAWTFDNSGDLTGLPGKGQFGTIPSEYRHLIEINVEERAGLIWGILTPGVPLDLEDYLGEMLPLIEKIGLADYHFGTEAKISGANWKLAWDGYIENYHFNILHKDTVGNILQPDYTSYTEVGPHVNYFVPGVQISDLRDQPESEWQASAHMMGAYNFFPSNGLAMMPSIDISDQAVSLVQVWPGKTLDTSVMRQVLAMPRPLATEQDHQMIEQTMAGIMAIIGGEDYKVVNGQQTGLDAMSEDKFIFGRMEHMVQVFEKRVNAIVDGALNASEC